MCYQKKERNKGKVEEPSASLNNKVNLTCGKQHSDLWMKGCLWLVWSVLEVLATSTLGKRFTMQGI